MEKNVFWAANAPAPLTRDQQIHLMKTAQERRAENIARLERLLKVDMNE